MAVRTLIALLFAILAEVAAAQPAPTSAPMPAWAEAAWQSLASQQGLARRTRLDPSMQTADFDGDGRADIAVLVVHVGSRKEGIAFLFRARPARVIGAGRSFGNGGDDFAWIDTWHVEPRAKARGVRGGRTLQIDGAGLVVEKESSASALIYLDSGRPRWRQYGD
jgi:hypothetical protein